MSTRQLKCRLTESEVAAAASELATRLDDVDSIKLAAKEAADNFKAEVSKVKKRSSDLRNMVRDHVETRMVECEDRMDYKAGIVHVIRLDTQEQIKTRTLTDDERQAFLPNIHTITGAQNKRGRAND